MTRFSSAHNFQMLIPFNLFGSCRRGICKKEIVAITNINHLMKFAHIRARELAIPKVVLAQKGNRYGPRNFTIVENTIIGLNVPSQILAITDLYPIKFECRISTPTNSRSGQLRSSHGTTLINNTLDPFHKLPTDVAGFLISAESKCSSGLPDVSRSRQFMCCTERSNRGGTQSTIVVVFKFEFEKIDQNIHSMNCQFVIASGSYDFESDDSGHLLRMVIIRQQFYSPLEKIGEMGAFICCYLLPLQMGLSFCEAGTPDDCKERDRRQHNRTKRSECSGPPNSVSGQISSKYPHPNTHSHNESDDCSGNRCCSPGSYLCSHIRVSWCIPPFICHHHLHSATLACAANQNTPSGAVNNTWFLNGPINREAA